MTEYLNIAYLKNIVDLLLPTVITIAVSSIALVVRLLVKRMTAKFDAEAKLIIQNLVDDIVSNGVAYAEQYAKIQQKNVNEQIDSSHKLEIATSYVLGEVYKHGLPEMVESEIHERIEAYLGNGTLEINLKRQGDSDEAF